MRSNVADYSLVAPPTLPEALRLLASDPGLTPIAGGTELMVALSAGRLPQKNLLSINHLRELRFIDVHPETITIGSGATFTDIRCHEAIAEDLPLLTQAASWTGSIANQNRGTLGGNIVNASPAADSPPALLVYEALVTLISARGERTIPYRDFHLGYKKTVLAPDEILHRITLLRNMQGYKQYIRKVGTRNAQAISKTALAVITRANQGIIEDIRIAAASLREVPTRLPATEQALIGNLITPETIAAARAALIAESKPIDDIRSTARYRASVAANLLEEFLLTL